VIYKELDEKLRKTFDKLTAAAAAAAY